MAAKRFGEILNSLSGTSGQSLRVKIDETGYEFANLDTGTLIVGALDGQTKTTSGINIVDSTLYMQTSSGTTYPGLISIGSQTIGGSKTFTSNIIGSITGNAGTVTSGVYTSGDQTIGGIKTFSSNIIGSITGNAGTVTNGVYTTGNQTISGSKTFTSEIIDTSIHSFRSVYGNYGAFWRNDGTTLYLLVTSGGDPYGIWSTARPLACTLATGHCQIQANRIDSNGANLIITNGGATTSQAVSITAGGEGEDYNIGAFITCYGHDSTAPGDLRIGAGTHGQIQMYCGGVSGVNTLRWSIDGNGTLKNDNTKLSVPYLQVDNTYASYESRLQELRVNRGPSQLFYFLATSTTYAGTPDTQHILSGDGALFIDGAISQNQADYAEYFENTNSGVAIDIGEVVVLDADHIRKFNIETDSLTNIIGVIRPKTTATSINHPLNWPGKYTKNSLGEYVLDETGNRIINEGYDPNLEYIWRSKRTEWLLVGLLGRIIILKSASKHPNWIKMKDIDETYELWFVR